MSRAAVVLSDSGGIQEEAPSVGVRVLLARTETERPEGVEAGTVALVGVERQSVRDALLRELDSGRDGAARANPYGDGHAAVRIAACLRFAFGLEPAPPAPFAGVGATSGLHREE
jgi:UDP-N-acetylglucosamine 2-epimerase (non-hydrolysing)